MNIQKENYKICQQQEEMLVFDHFTHEDAWRLGESLISDARERGIIIACDIWLNGYQVFRYGMEGTGPYHDLWLKRKMRTVKMFEKSSLRVHCMPYVGEDDLVKNAHLDPSDFSAMGGGFPIRVKNCGMTGILCVSGGAHTDDHQMAVDGLAGMLGIQAPKVINDQNGKLIEADG